MSELETFNLLLNNIESIKHKFIDESLKQKIYYVVRTFFSSLNDKDLKALQILTTFIVDLISFKYHFSKNDIDYINQWTQNANRDIKGVILLLLPFIDDKDNGYLLQKIQDLNQMLYAYNDDFIPNNVLDLEREQIKSTYFEYGNMGIGLIKPNTILKFTKQDKLLNLYVDNEKLIYKVIHHNFIGLLQTLEITNGKTYINWVNISPLNLSNYRESGIYKATKDKIKEIKVEIKSKDTNKILELLSDNLLYYSGLWVGDIYNILRHRYYEHAKKIKWLFFAYEPSNLGSLDPKSGMLLTEFGKAKLDNEPTGTTIQIYLIQGLNKMFDIDKIINNDNSYDDISQTDKTYFIDKVNYVIEKLSGASGNITGNTQLDFEILKYTLIYLFSNYSNKDRFVNNKYNKFILTSISDIDENNEDEDKDDDFTKIDIDKINIITNNDIIDCLQYIKNDHINDLWEFIKESIQMLEVSAYGKYLILSDDNSKKISDKYYWQIIHVDNKLQNTKLNLKNIYNISKSISHISTVKSAGKSKWILLDNNYISFDDENKILFLQRVNNLIDYSTWINLNGNFKRQYMNPDYTDKKHDEQIKLILEDFSSHYINLIFEELVCCGILNKFTPNLNITDKTLLSHDTSVRKTELKDNITKLFKKHEKDWNDSYYYLTNKKFSKLDKMRLDKKKTINPNDKYDEMSYFEIIGKDHEWPVFYAMDWISQISFFQHYIFHQIMYVTGATGQGKSTQVPKLLLYALKCIDYKSNGKVICTQPRQPPTVNNASRISEELGVPIRQTINYSTNKIDTYNFYVQFKHQQESHTSDSNSNANYNSLKIVTDGTLLLELKKNPTLKKSFNEKLINTNVYDIVIVDEAHEHNTNMDIIIALSKQACYVNNQVRLIIVSATMDDDEPIYRRYFYNINDKLLFPIKYPILHPFFKKTNFLPLPKYMDRRYHISPPGATTQYRVDEYYLEHDLLVYNPDNSINETKSAEKSQLQGYAKVIEICNKSSTGEILFFANGKGEILEAVKYLNSSLPPGNIALPYFSELNQTYKNIIDKIDIKISTIRNRRDKIHEEWGTSYVEDITVPAGIYKRSIIIATNVAEASVTIPNLAYVVDNGFAKVNTFNEKLSISKLNVEKISESSRIQRRGRVGRVGDGSVYYMYKKDSRKFIKPKYKITQDDVSITILSLMGFKPHDEVLIDDTLYYKKLIVSSDINPNIFNTLSIIENANTNASENKNYYTIKSGLCKLYKQNYRINNKILDKIYYIDEGDYFIDNEENENNLMEPEFFMFNDGQIISNIFDCEGNFYLIHPFENSIKRNILNNIINCDNKENNIIPINKFVFIINYLYSKNLIINTNYNLYNNIISSNEEGFVKTELGEKILELEMPIPDAITMISAAAMECLNEVYEINIFIQTIETLDTLVSKNSSWNKFKEIYGNIKSDIIFIHEIIKKIKANFPNLYLFNLNSRNVSVMLTQHYDAEIIKFKKLSRSSKEPPADYDVLLWNKLKKVKNISTLNSEIKPILKVDKSTLNIIISNINANKKDIITWAERNYLNSDIILKVLNKLGEYYLLEDVIDSKSKIFEWAKELSSNYNKYLTEYNIEEKIIRSFLYGKSTQFTFNFENYLYDSDNYLQTYMNYNILTVGIKNTKTLTNITNNIMFYLNYKETEELNLLTGENIINISFINQIEPAWLIPTAPIFFNSTFNDILKLTDKDNNDSIEFIKSRSFKRIQKEIANNWNQDFNIWDSDKTPILRDFYKKITKKISRINNN
jgi:hypothetical protein